MTEARRLPGQVGQPIEHAQQATGQEPHEHRNRVIDHPIHGLCRAIEPEEQRQPGSQEPGGAREEEGLSFIHGRSSRMLPAPRAAL